MVQFFFPCSLNYLNYMMPDIFIYLLLLLSAICHHDINKQNINEFYPYVVVFLLRCILQKFLNVLILSKQTTVHDALIQVHWVFFRVYVTQNNSMIYTLYSQTCIKRSWPLGQRQSDLLRKAISWKRFNSYEIFCDGTSRRWPIDTGDCLIEVTKWAG
jgi:hypothetical protein